MLYNAGSNSHHSAMCRTKSLGKVIGDFLGFLEGRCSATGDCGRFDGPPESIVNVVKNNECMISGTTPRYLKVPG